MILLRNFNRRFTVIRLPQFGNPMIADINALELPRGSIYHYLPSDVSEIGPSQTLPILNRAEKLMQINHNLHLPQEVNGRPIAIPQNIEKEILIYHRMNRKIRRMREETVVLRDDRTLLIENYAPLPGLFRYSETQMSWYDRWANIYATMISRLQYDTKKFSNRQNYIFLELPNVVPPIAQMIRAERTRNVSTLKSFRSDEQLRLLDLWTWLGPNRDASQFGKFDVDQLKHINIVVTYKGKFFNLNLGELDFWRQGGPNPQAPVNPLQMQRRLYVTITRLAKEATVAEATARKQELADKALADSKAATDGVLDTDDRPDEEGEEDEFAQPETDPVEKNQADLAIGEGDESEDAPIIDDSPEAIQEEIAKFDQIEIDENAAFEIVAAPQDTIDQVYMPDYDFNQPITHEEGVLKECERYISGGQLTTREYQRAVKLANSWRAIPAPNGAPMEEFIKVDPKVLQIEPEQLAPETPTMYDKSMAKSTIKVLSKRYIKDVLPRDIAASCVNLQKAGFMVMDYNVERVVDAANCADIYSIKVSTINGKESTLRFTLPTMDEQGYWKSNDTEYTMRKQRVDIPIRKTAPDTVTITSFYGKNFIRRSEAKANDWNRWLVDQIIAASRDKDNLVVEDVKYSNVFTPEIKLPRDYTAIAGKLRSFRAGNVTFNFDAKHMEETFTAPVVAELAEQEMVPVGKSGTTLYAMDQYSTVYKRTAAGNQQALGTIAEVAGLDLNKAPKEFTELSMMGKSIPLAIVFCYYFGLERALKLFRIPYRVTDVTERIAPATHDIIIKTVDAKVVISPTSYEQRLMINGIHSYSKVIRDFTLRDMNEPDVYLNLIQKNGLTVRYLRELDLMDTMFIDPITERQLVKMKEPTTFRGLLKRANEMLTYDQHPDEINADYMHYYGAQRLAGTAYVEIVRAIREYHNKPGTNKKLDMHPNAVWQSIVQDGSCAPASDANPMHSIKEATVITYGGTGGRSRRSMVKHTRRYLKEDLGVLSGDVVDNGDVGMTAYLAANPMIADLDGYADPERGKKLEIGSILSPACLVSPAILFDDGKRMNFAGIQMGSTTSCVGGETASVRTGEELMIAHLARDTQAVTAEDDGKIIEVTGSYIAVQYGSGKNVEVKKYRLGRHFGRHEGGTYPQDIKSDLKVGSSFKKGTVITYNAMHFEPDVFNKGQVNWKPGPIVSAFFIEGNDTIEDSSAIDKETSAKLATDVSKPKCISIRFDEAVHNLVTVGTEVDPETILCNIEDPLTATSNAFSEESKRTLDNISDASPRAGVAGVIDKIEVFYNGQIEDMSPTLAAIAKAGDKRRKLEAAVSPDTLAETGQVDSSLRLDGRPVELDKLVIRMYITHRSPAIGGDKCVVANQMKSTFRRRMVGRNYVDDGQAINIIFGRKSVDERIVYSVYQIGVATTWGRLMATAARKLVAEMG